MALRPYDRQGELLGPSPDSVLAPDHLARVLDELVEAIGVGRLNRRYSHTPGEPAYDVRLLCKVLIYAYARGITSSREMARQCVENLAFRFVTSGQCPDHRTLSRFRRRQRRLLRWVLVRADVIPTDPEAVWVKKQGKIIPGYNCHAAVDAERGVVVAVKAVAEASERGQLNPMIEQVQRTAGAAAETAVADNGYYSDEAIVQAEDGPSRCLVPDGTSAKQLNAGGAVQPPSPYHCENFAYDEASDTFTCAQRCKLVVQKQHERRGLPTTVYAGVDCGRCPVRGECTQDKRGLRTIEVHREYAKIRRAHERLRSAEGQRLYGRRKAVVEPVFGQWQHNCGVRRLRLRGVRGCEIELHLLAIGHNAKKFWRNGVRFSAS